VDVESVARVAAAGFDDVAFDARERALLRDDRARTRLWAAKEAVLKSTGEGLRTAPTLVSVADSARGRRDDLAVLAAPASVGIVHLEVIDDGGDLVVVLATRAAERPTVDYSSGTGTA
jgi:4'-phosphopantetheinyl transferase